MKLARRACALAALAAGLAVPLATDPATARPERDGSAKRARKAPTPSPGPLLAVISLDEQRIKVYGSAGLVAQSAVSTGRAGYRTPSGVFSVLQKRRWHQSNIYSGAPMPFMQRITWSGLALHAGVLPGYPASHGCIRLSHQFAAELWGMTGVGTRVVVSPEDVAVIETANAGLPVPLLLPADGATASAAHEEESRAPARAVSLASAAPDDVASDAAAAPRLLNPSERAAAARAFAVADAAAKAKAAKSAVAASAAASEAANEAIIALRDAELAAARLRAQRDAAVKGVETAKSPEAAERATAALAALDARIAESTQAVEAAAALAARKTPEAFEAARQAWQAERASEAAAAALKDAERGVSPLTIFVSRKTGRVYIRQAWAPVYRESVFIKDPEVPLGTHVYLAVAPQDGGQALRWLSLTMPVPGDDDARPARRGKEREPAPPLPRETASSVLDRIVFSEEAKAFIANRLWVGATLIVSDQPISNETGLYTDIIVLTR